MNRILSALLCAGICSLIFAAVTTAQSGSAYNDPQQRFTILVQAGWLAEPFDNASASGVTIVHGADSYVQIYIQKGTDPATFLKALNDGMKASIPGFHVTDSGSSRVGGQSGSFIIGDSQEAAGKPHHRIFLETLSENGFTYAVVASTSGEASADQGVMADYSAAQDMIHSLAFHASSTQNSIAAAPVPARTATPSASPAQASESTIELSSDDKKKLATLDAALKNGVLTRGEYETKKNAMYDGARTQQANAPKMKALDQAYKDGVLTREEYDRKKADLNSAAAPPETSQLQNPGSGGLSARPADASVAKSSLQSGSASSSFTTHTDPAGFAVDLPGAWNVAKDAPTGQVILHGTRGEQVMIWPLFLQNVQLDPRGAGTLIQQLARKFDGKMSWVAAPPMQNVIRVMATGGQRSGTAMLSWANNSSGASIYFYAVAAPTDVYRQSTDSFVGILKSFHIVQDPSMKDIPVAASAAGALSFVNWNDPHEGAFSAAVPRGWQVIGGTYRLSATDVRYSLAMGSPDGQIRATIGDSNIGTFTEPTPMLSMGGLREGGYQTLGDGSKLQIRRYTPGEQFARSYVETFVSHQCSGLQIGATNARADLTATFGQMARNEGAARGHLTAGDVSFTCNLNGRPVQGRYIAATLQVAPGQTPLWVVYRLYGYLVLAGREQDGDKVVNQALQSWKFSPQWEAQQRNTANAAVQADNARSQQIRERAQQAIYEDQRETNDMIIKGGEERNKVYDEISRKRENSILGTLDVVDPETGTQYKVSNYGDYHYMSNEGYIYSTNSPNAPAPDLREMVTLP